ncbi:hypothetical protein MATL_G00093380 [Megalops atlanticus]|uniref:Zinc finger protein 276 n=1 Tax=Megalops atlanticus TaxID=7932 RepID=A0A9D3Q1E6_MEGAT|nr:hypothetical protein MATL_G00093380 [Megalops atlanticus]
MKRDRRGGGRAVVVGVGVATRRRGRPGPGPDRRRRQRRRSSGSVAAAARGCDPKRADGGRGGVGGGGGDGPGGRSVGAPLPAAVSAEVGSAENEARQPGSFCRLCHGRFSSRGLRHAFGVEEEEEDDEEEEEEEERDEEERARRTPAPFCADFQRLVGVPLSRDPVLSAYVCRGCRAQFYKCRRVLRAFLHRVNLPPLVGGKGRDRSDPLPRPSASEDGGSSVPPRAGLLGPPPRRRVRFLPPPPGGAGGTVPGRGAGRLDVRRRAQLRAGGGAGRGRGAFGDSRGNAAPKLDRAPSPRSIPGTAQPGSTGPLRGEETATPAPADPVDGAGDSDLSDRNFSSEDEEDDRRKGTSSDELFEPFPEKRVISPKKGVREAKAAEPKVRKKPGPKPGWKKKTKSEREELPNIYKCPHQGCTAVYRGADGMKKHIKEHHEEVRERPCPHPGCNKVFMIDRYLQRHVKLIHTEVRNYICDQCGQTFKQRKHLSVHQMRHSGAKPLQCEVCGFQCRQRASLKYHMTKHKAEAELEFACGLCGRRFEKAHNLNVHMSMVHPLTQQGAGVAAQGGGGGGGGGGGAAGEEG